MAIISVVVVFLTIYVTVANAKSADEICYDKMITDVECMHAISLMEEGKYELTTALACFTKAQVYCHAVNGAACFHIRKGGPRELKCLDMPPSCVEECADVVVTTTATTVEATEAATTEEVSTPSQ